MRSTHATRRAHVILLALLLLLAALSATAEGSSARVAGPDPATRSAAKLSTRSAGRINVIEIMTDDMRYDDLAYMPHLRAQVTSGVRFVNSFSSFPFCCPARADFQSGLLNHNNGIYGISGKPSVHGGYTYFDDTKNIGTAMKGAGYNTGFVGKYLNGYGADYKQRFIRRIFPPGSRNADSEPANDVPRGWTIWQGSLDGNAYSVDRPELNGVGHHPGSTYKYLDMTTSTNSGDWVRHRGKYSTYVVDRLARAQIRAFHAMRAASGKPFFMSVNFVAPHVGFPRRSVDQVNGHGFHTAYTPPATDAPFRRYLDRHGLVFARGAGINKPDVVSRVGSFTDPTLQDQPWDDQAISASDVEWTAKNDRRRAQSLWLVDRQIPELVHALKASGEWKRTIVFFTSDNGYFLGENGMPYWKVITMEPSLRVPLVAFGGALPRTNLSISSPITTVDLSATIMAMGGARPPWGHTDGRSLWPAMNGNDQGWQRVARFESRYPELMPSRQPRLNHFSIRTPRYYYGVSEGIVEMYDLETDPVEWYNLVQRDGTVAPGYEDVASTLRSLLDQTMNCRGAAQCEPALPASLDATRSEAMASYDAWFETVHDMVGNF